MKKFASMAVAGTLVLGLGALPASAWGPGKSAQSGEYSQSGQYGQSQSGQSGQPGMMGQQGTMGQQAQRPLEQGFVAQAYGQVTSVDHSTGRLTIQTPDGPVTARFPVEAIQNVRQGDQVALRFGLTDIASPSASPQTSPQMPTNPSQGTTPSQPYQSQTPGTSR